MMFRIMEDDRDDRTLLISIYDGMLMELRHRNPQNFGIANIIVERTIFNDQWNVINFFKEFYIRYRNQRLLAER